ncbi:Heat shock 70 kDa protein cognate 4-like protein [Aphelenchoides besseyi]|nr:Heat shock 70 kDa protein cognate 4-like protein [Aphelenchoides besseyi]
MVTIAIDFGTTFTRIAAINCSKHCVVRDEHRNTAIPSVVGFSEKGLLFGTSALKLMESNSANTIIHLVRLLDLNSNHITNHQTRRHLSHSLNKMESSKIGIPVRNCGHDYVFAPEEIIAMFMTYVKQLVEKVFVSETVERTVLIVPSCFNTAKRRMLKEAMEAAGIKVRRFISSQMAVAMRFVDMDTSVEMKKILLLSVNGGTTEASILSVHYGQVNGHEVEIKSTAGNDRLGGIDFTNALINHYVDEIKKDTSHQIKRQSSVGSTTRMRKGETRVNCKTNYKNQIEQTMRWNQFLDRIVSSTVRTNLRTIIRTGQRSDH